MIASDDIFSEVVIIGIPESYILKMGLGLYIKGI